MSAYGAGDAKHDHLRENEHDDFSLMSRMVALDIGEKTVRSERP